MGEGEIVVVGLLVAVAGLSVLARRLSLPYPIVQDVCARGRAPVEVS